MRQFQAIFSLLILASMKLSFGATVIIQGSDCVDTYIEATSPGSNYEGKQTTLSQI